MRRVFIVVLAAMLMAALAIPVSAATDRTTGDQIRLFPVCTHETYPAGEAFHVQHGHSFPPPLFEDLDMGEWTFELMVDGQLLPLSQIRVTEVSDPPNGNFLSKAFVYNFPNGLSAGSHTLAGIWTNADGAQFTPTPCSISFED